MNFVFTLDSRRKRPVEIVLGKWGMREGWRK
jgi:hypothetical protein